MKFTKVQSLGNDFVLVEAQNVDADTLPALARNVCRRNFSIGSDGLLVIDRGRPRVKLRMFNPDGSEDFCGNGLRCAALYAFQHGWAESKMEIEHHGRLVQARVKPDGLVETEMGLASYQPEDVPSTAATELFESPLDVEGQQLTISALSTGSTHVVIFVDDLPRDEDFLRLSPAIENHDLFPERTSVMWTHIVDERRIKIRIWERGAGETLGCGTGSCAAASATLRKMGLTGEIEVVNPGGTVLIRMPSYLGPIHAEGRAFVAYTGNLLPAQDQAIR